MVWILFIVGILLLAIGYIIDYCGDSIFTFIGWFITIPCTIVLCYLYGIYYYNKHTLDSQIVVLEQQNEIVLSQIEPIVNNALTFESETYKELKLSPERIIAIGQMYPDLKNNTFLQTQMEIIIHNQQEITRLKLAKARLKKHINSLYGLKLNNYAKYILVEWPKSQYFIGIENCYYINPMEDSNLDQAMFVPEETYNKIMNNG